MKKAISVLLAVILSVSQLALCAEAANNPLQASDRITQQLAETTARKQEIEANRIQRGNMKNAALSYGATSKDTNNLGFILNRKTMTKREYEAFKWSFILSQFAVPLEDSLLDVFSQNLFNEMITANMDIAAVQNALQYGGTNPADIKIMTSMLQDTNFTDVVETIKSNYSLLYLYKENDTPLVLADVLYGSLAVNERFYVYDTILSCAEGSTANQVNALYYRQEALADTSSLPGYSISSKKLPVAIYDASFYLYLQLAVGTYCLKNSTSVLDLETIYGQAQLVVDSYGNICVYTSEGAKIIMPNFGNSIFVNKDAGEGANGWTTFVGQIDLYNKWVTTLYTRTQRTHVGATTEMGDIFGEFSPIALGGNSKITYDDTTLDNNESQQGIAGQYISELPVKNGGSNLSGTLMLVDPADISVYPASMVSWLEESLVENKGITHAFSPVHNSNVEYPITNRKSNLYLNVAEIIHKAFFIGQNESERSTKSFFQQLFGGELTDNKHLEFKHNVTEGTIYSNYATISDTGAFTHSLSTDTSDAFINPYPIINVDINLASIDVSSASGKSHYYRAAMSLLKGSWRYSVASTDGTRNEKLVYSGINGENTSQHYLQALNGCLVMATTFNSDQLIRDLRFVSDRAAKQNNGNDYAEIYLPMSVINIGQNCSAFVGDEKGMFVAQHRDYFSSSMSQFRTLCVKYLNMLINTVINSNGAKEFRTGINFSAEYFGNTGIIELQSSKKEENAQSFIWQELPVSYYKGLSVAVSMPSPNKTPHLTDWEPTEIEIDGEYYWDYSDLADYLESAYHALRTYKDDTFSKDKQDAKTLYFSTSLCCGGNNISDSEKDAHTGASNMRSGESDNDIKLVVTRGSKNWTLAYTTYINGEEQKNGTVTITEDEVEYEENGEEYTFTYWKYEDSDTDILDIVSGQDDDAGARLVNMINFFIVCGKANTRLADVADSSIASFKAELKAICAPYGFDVNEMLYALSMLQSGYVSDTIDNGGRDIYFFDEYQYLLRNASIVSGEPGSQNSLDLAAIMYYWDRAYLPELSFNKRVTELTSSELGIARDGSVVSDSAYARWLDYQDFLQTTGTTKVQYSFKKFLEDNFTNNGLDIPFCQELLLQLETFDEYIEQNSTIQQYFDSQTQAYNYLDPDTIILYPVIDESPTTNLKVFSGLADTVAAISASLDTGDDAYAVVSSSTITNFRPLSVIMALQCNTDYEHNYLVAAPTKVAEVQHVSKEELMDKANTFFDNPVSSLSYILAGFLYKAHTAVATGSLGSVFSANWLVESSIYKWIMARYVAIVTIIVVVLLAIKLTMFAMSKTRDYWSIGRATIGILAMCMVPLIVFNGFIWAFDTTSHWALAGPTNKMLLSEINASVLERVNNDPGVTAEFNAFREQFTGLQGEYDGLTFEEIIDYSLDGPVYRQVPLASYSLHLQFGTDKKTWFTDEGFVPVNLEHYDESMFYYFYDFIKSEFFNYAMSHADQNMPSSTYISAINNARPYLADAYKGDDVQKEAWIKITSAEAGLAKQTGEFVSMLKDTDFVYSLSINPQLSDRYGGAYAKDLAGVYNLFNPSVNKDNTAQIEVKGTSSATYNAIKNAAWRKCMNDSKIMAVDDSINPRLWTDKNVVMEFIEKQSAQGNSRSLGLNSYVITSKLDLFDSYLNGASYWVDTRYNDLVLTPLEEKLCEVTTSIYEDTLKALEYHEAEIKNESAIQLMAWIATFRVSEAFDLEPSAPIPQTVTLDTIVRTAFVSDLNTVSSNENTMYSLIAQGDSIGKLVLVLLLETAIAVAGILRIFIILYITGASFVIFALRLLHKAPRTTDLIYGIIGNVLALLALHALTLFLVVVSVEWVANATNNIPGLVLDLVMIAFGILICRFLYQLLKNLVKDAVNLGGAKIKAGVHNVIGKFTDMITQAAGINSLATQLESADVTLNADNLAEQSKLERDQLLYEQMNRERVERISSIIHEIEEEEGLKEQESNTQALESSQPSFDAKIARINASEKDMADSN